MKRKYDRQIILEDGSKYSGYGFGDMQDKILEIVFNTSMVGYQEILSDPSYTDQAVVMTYPLIGNYGMADEDYETDFPTIGALIVHEYNDEPSNFRSSTSLGDVMRQFGMGRYKKAEPVDQGLRNTEMSDHRYRYSARRGSSKTAQHPIAQRCRIKSQQQRNLELPRK